jgi:hypothetical protein
MVNNSTSETDNHLSLKPFNTKYIPRNRVFEIQVMAWDRHTNVAMLNRTTFFLLAIVLSVIRFTYSVSAYSMFMMSFTFGVLGDLFE